MKINENVAIYTSRVLLVPYTAEHVPTYHAWMQNPCLQALTASEPLTLEEEYAMQQSWRTDRDKLTFIVCHSRDQTHLHAGTPIRATLDDAPHRLLGDVNLFLSLPDDEDDDGVHDGLVGEIELMIAREEFQGHGYGRAALVLFMQYVLLSWIAIADEFGAEEGTGSRRLAYFRVKIDAGNLRSLALFRSVGFEQVGEVNFFGEVELRWMKGVEELEGWKGFERLVVADYGLTECR